MLRDEAIETPVKAWYVLHVKPHKELQVYRYLRDSAEDLELYLPTMSVKSVNPRAARNRPYFPRYLFINTALETTGESALQWVPGAVGLVRFGGEPAIVPENFIHELNQRIEQMDRDGGLSRKSIQPGDRVRLTSGAFADCEAVFDGWLSGEERVQVLLYWLGRRVKVTTATQSVAKL